MRNFEIMVRFMNYRNPPTATCVGHGSVEKVRALSGGEGSLIDTGGVSMLTT